MDITPAIKAAIEEFTLKSCFSYNESKYSNRFNLNAGERDNRRIIYKYMSIDSFKKSINDVDNGSLRFIEPTGWLDKYESRFYLANYANLAATVEDIPRVYGCCFTTKKTSDAAWYVYRDSKLLSEGNKDGYCVKLRINRSKLCEQLCKFGKLKDKQYKIYDGLVDYSLNDTQIQYLHKKQRPYNIEHTTQYKENPLFKKIFGDSKITLFVKYLNLLLIKREIFKYEHEFRIFLVGNPRLMNMAKNAENPQTEFACVDWSQCLESVEVDSNYPESEFKKLKAFCKSKLRIKDIVFTWEKHNAMEEYITIDSI